jgi:thiol peroxidase
MANITLGGTPTRTIGNLPEIGSIAPKFTGVKSDLSPFDSNELDGKNIIINIFASIDTSICAESTRKFNEKVSTLDNTVVVCVSMDLPFALERICGGENLKNIIPVSVFRSNFGNDYGVTILDGAFEGLLSRSVVVINSNGSVIYTEQVPEIGQEPNYDAAIGSL